MAGLQSQNISVASTHVPRSTYGGGEGGSMSVARSTCVFCGRRSYPPASDPHAPVFALFSLVDCPHYACQPCALVHCDNAGRLIECPTCHCVSRLAQTGKKRSASKRAKEEAAAAEARRVGLDDGVSSVVSRGSRRSGAAHHTSTHSGAGAAPRSALKKDGSGTSKKRASSVQFPSGLATRSGSSEGEGESGNSPLTADAINALPVDPQHAAKTRGRRAEVPSSDGGSSDHAVGLYALSTKKPKSSTRRSSSGSRRRPPLAPDDLGTAPLSAKSGATSSRERPQSLPAPQLENRLLPPPEPFVAPPPLHLHTVEEDDAAAAAAAAAAEQRTAEEAALLAQFQKDEVEACVSAEQEERDILDAAWRHSMRKLQVAKDDDWTAINTRRELEDEFALSPGGTPSPFSHANNISLQTAPSAAETPGAVIDKPRKSDQEDEGEKKKSMAPSTAADDAESTTASTHAKTPEESQVSVTSDDASPPSSVSKDSGGKRAHGSSKRRKAKTELLSAATADPPMVSAGTSPIPGPPADGDDAPKAMADTLIPEDAAAQSDQKGEKDDEDDENTASASAVSEMTSAARSDPLVFGGKDRLQLEQLEAIERYAIEDVEAAVRKHYDQLVEHVDEALARTRDDLVQEAARVAVTRDTAAQADLADAERVARAEIEVAQSRSWGTVGEVEAHARVEAARMAAQREQDTLSAVLAAQREHETQNARTLCENAEEPSDRLRVEAEEQVARQRLRQDAVEGAAVFDRQRAQQGLRILSEIDDVCCEEDDDRFTLREEERVGRREIRVQLLHTLANQRRAEAYAHDQWTPPHGTQSAAPRLAADEAVAGLVSGTNTMNTSATDSRPSAAVLSDPFTGSGLDSVNASDPHSQAQQAVNRTLPAPPHLMGSQLQSSPVPHSPSPTTGVSFHTPSEHLARQLHEVERYYQDEISETYARLREAQRRLQEEELARDRAERERAAAQDEANRLVEEAERHAEERIRRARLATEQELEERLESVRSESERRAAHEATLRALQEEEQRAVLEVKLLAAQRALEEAQQRALDDMHRAREEVAAQAAAEAARVERQAREREAELEAKRHAENMLRLAQQTREREEAAEQLRLVERRANEAIQRARDEAQQAADEAQAHLESVQARQAMRAAELQDAQAHVHQAMKDIRAHDVSHRTSPVDVSAYTNASGTPVMRMPVPANAHNVSSVSTVFVSHHGPREGQTAASHVAAPIGDTSFDAPQPQQEPSYSAVVPGYAGVQPRPPEASPPPRFSPPRPVIMKPQPLRMEEGDGDVHASSQSQQPPQATAVGYAYTPSGIASPHGSSAQASPVRETTMPPRASTPRESTPVAATGAPMTPRTMVATIVEPMFAHFQALTDRLIQNTIREAAREVEAARMAAQSLRDDANERLHESARRYRRRRADRDRVAHDLSHLTHQSSLASSGAVAAGVGAASESRSQRSGGATGMSDAGAFDRSDVSASASYCDPCAMLSVGSVESGSRKAGGRAAARTLFFDQPSPVQIGRELPYTRSQPAPARGSCVLSQYYQPPPFTYTAMHHPETLLAGHRYFFQRAAPFTSVPNEPSAGTPVAQATATAQEQSPQQQTGEAPMHASPPRRSQTRADGGDASGARLNQQEAQQPSQPPQQQPVPVRMDFSPGPPSSTAFSTSIGSVSVLPQVSPVCMQCYRDDTTSPCWQCGAMICRRCGPPMGPRRLCCAAHFRSLRRASRKAAAERQADAFQRFYEQQQQQQQQHVHQENKRVSRGAEMATLPLDMRATKASLIPIDANNSSADDEDCEAVAGLPDAYSAGDSSLSSTPRGDHHEVAPVVPSQYHVPHSHRPLPYSPTQSSGAATAQALPSSLSVTAPRREAVATQTSPNLSSHAEEKHGTQDAPGHAMASSPSLHMAAASPAEGDRTPILQTMQSRTDKREAAPGEEADEAAENAAERGADAPDPQQSQDARAVLVEPKTEKKKSYGLFFVPLDPGGDGEPRRAKPPTPRNYQPHVHAPQQRTGRSGRGVRMPSPQHREGPHRARSRAGPQRSTSLGHRPVSQSAVPRGDRRHRPIPEYDDCNRGHHTQPALHTYQPGQRLWRPPTTKAANAYQPQRSKPSTALGTPQEEEELAANRHRPLPASRAVYPSQPPSYAQYPRGTNTPSSTTLASGREEPAPTTIDADTTSLSSPSSPPSSAVVHAAAELLSSRPRMPLGMVRTPEMTRSSRPAAAPMNLREPMTCGKRGLPSAGTDEYHSYASDADELHKPYAYPSHPPQEHRRRQPYTKAMPSAGADGRYRDVRPSSLSSKLAAPYDTNFSRSSAPTLEELDRRLRQLRTEDRHSNERYFLQQQQQRPRALYNPDIYVNMMMPSGSGGTRSRSRGQSRERTARQRAAVSPPWRTDDNSPAVQPPWNVRKSQSPLYRPRERPPVA